MELSEVINKRYSYRRFDQRNVEDATLNQIFELARLAPSSGNLQSFRVVVVRDLETKQKLRHAAAHQEFIELAPVVLVICAVPGEQEPRYGQRGRDLYALQDATIFGAYVQLVAVDMGLATCWIGAFREHRVRDALSLPEELQPVTLMPMGYTSDVKTGRRKKSIEQIIHVIQKD